MPSIKLEDALWDCIETILGDGCPGIPNHQLCRESEDYDDGICVRCWENYVMDIRNGQTKFVPGIKRINLDAELKAGRIEVVDLI